MGDRTNPARHLEAARELLAVAEAGDARHEAYRHAADHLAAYRESTGATYAAIAADLQLPEGRVARLLAWRASGYTETTPWAREGKDTSAANAHAKRVLRERPEVIADELAKVSAERRAAFAAGLMADPEVAGAVMAQPEVRLAVAAADTERAAKEASRRERAEAAFEPITQAAATLGAFEWLEPVRAMASHVAWLVENDATLTPEAVAEARELLRAADTELVVYSARHGYPAGASALGAHR
jgi:hypothetical protein